MDQKQKLSYRQLVDKSKYSELSENQQTVFDAVDKIQQNINELNEHENTGGNDDADASDAELDEYLKQNLVTDHISDSDTDHYHAQSTNKRVLRTGLDIVNDKFNKKLKQ